MLVEVKVPQLSESVAEATLVSWHKKAGEYVKRDENLVDIETDKVVLETPAPQAGVLVKIVKADGSTVTSSEIIATIDTDAKPEAGKAEAVVVAAATPAAAPAKAAAASPAMPSAQKMAAGSPKAMLSKPRRVAPKRQLRLRLRQRLRQRRG